MSIARHGEGWLVVREAWWSRAGPGERCDPTRAWLVAVKRWRLARWSRTRPSGPPPPTSRRAHNIPRSVRELRSVLFNCCDVDSNSHRGGQLRPANSSLLLPSRSIAARLWPLSVPTPFRLNRWRPGESTGSVVFRDVTGGRGGAGLNEGFLLAEVEHVRGGCWRRCSGPHRPAVRRGLDSDRRHREVSGAPKPRGADTGLVPHRAFIAILLSIPDQSFRVLGVEFVALAVVTGGGLLVLGRRARVGPDPRDATAHVVGSLLDAVAPTATTWILLVIAGLLLVFGLHAGLDVLVLAVLVALAGGVTSAWLLLTKIPQ